MVNSITFFEEGYCCWKNVILDIWECSALIHFARSRRIMAVVDVESGMRSESSGVREEEWRTVVSKKGMKKKNKKTEGDDKCMSAKDHLKCHASNSWVGHLLKESSLGCHWISLQQESQVWLVPVAVAWAQFRGSEQAPPQFYSSSRYILHIVNILQLKANFQ